MPSETSNAERPQFFARAAMIMGLIVLLSFPLTYYVPLAQGGGKFDALHHWHALVFFAWFALYVWQTRLVARGQIARHRELGLLGFALTGVMLPMGYWMAQRAAQHRVASMAHPYEFTWFNLMDLSLFGILMLAAIVLVTRHKEWHRRLVYVAAVCLVAPAATRWTLRLPGLDALALDVASYLIMYPFLIALVRFDWRANGRVHPATCCSIALVVPLQIASAWIARSSWWNALAPVLVAAPS